MMNERAGQMTGHGAEEIADNGSVTAPAQVGLMEGISLAPFQPPNYDRAEVWLGYDPRDDLTRD